MRGQQNGIRAFNAFLMKTRLLWIIAALSLLPVGLRAQYKLSDKPEEFMTGVTTILAATKNEDAIKTGKELESMWGGQLNGVQQQKLITVTRKMAAKRYKALPHFTLLFKTVCHAVNTQRLSGQELDNLLTMTEKATDQYENKALTKMLETLALFLEKKTLYKASTNRLYAPTGSFTFAFREATPDAFAEQTENTDKANSNTKPATDNGQNQSDGWFSDWDAPQNTDQTGFDTATVFATDYVFSKPVQPSVMGAVILFNKTDLVFATGYDSVQLSGTQGSLMLKDGIFVGSGGKFDWSMAGLPQVFCTLGEYNFETRSPRLSAEGVKLTYPEKLTAPVEGVFEFVSKRHKGPENAQYPRFMSFYSNISVKDVGKNLVYKGGFSLMGKRVYSSSVNNRPSTLTYVAEGVTKFKTSGKRYELGDSVIYSPLTQVVIPQNQDSISHPAVQLNYNKNIPMLRLNKHEGGFRGTPYTDTYHKVDITADGLQWDLNGQEVNFYMLNARSEVPAVFESYDFFDSTRYVSLTGNYKFHPLQMLLSYANSTGSSTFNVSDLAAKYKTNENTLRGAMMQTMQQGYIDYEPESGMISVGRKTDHNVMANNRKRDYDSFRIESYNPQGGPNATINLGSNELVIKGIDRFYLSEKLNVSVKPRNKEIKLLKDRNFLLEGEVAAGTYKFKGSGFFFLYDEFTVEMPQIDTILFASKESLKKGDKKELGSEIRYGAGTLYINKPNNKAGLKDFPEYPRLNVESGATIYFDQKDRKKGTYNRNVRFEIPTVKLDSLNSRDPNYQGTFYSDGIFPPIKEALTPMSDNTLGFRHKPTGELALYESTSKIKFDGEIIMDMKGLRTSGTIEHLSTTLSSKDILFTPDSVVAQGASAQIKEMTISGGSFPAVSVKEYKLRWLPRADSMIISNVDSPFEIYKQYGSTFKGSLVVNSKGLFGKGTLERKDSEVYSPAFTLDKTKYQAKDAEFRIKSNDLTKPVLFANFVNVNFDMGQGLATISTSDNPAVAGFASLEFPYASYKTSINKAKWDINKKSVVMEGDVKTSTFTSIEPTHEGLSFNARFALYNVEKYTLNIGGVPYVQSADARIMPKGGVVRILENGIMEPLSGAQLLIDTVHAYHNLIEGEVQILSKSTFTGHATYKYVNSEKQEFKIKMGDFQTVQEEVEKKKGTPKLYTVAQGEVLEEDKFLVAPRILYKGKITMLAPEKNLKMDGAIKLDLKSQAELGAWIPYTSDQENIVINMDEIQSGGTQIFTGLHVDKATSELYTTFISEKRQPDDENVFTATGQLNFNPSNNEFKVAAVEKATNVTMEGNQFVLDDAAGRAKMEGKIDFFNSAGNDYVFSAGSGMLDLNKNDYSFNALLGLAFQLPPQTAEKIGETMVQTKLDKGVGELEANTDMEALYVKIAAVAGDKTARDYKNKASKGFVPLPKADKKFLATLVLSNVNLKWSDTTKSFYSVGKIGVSNVVDVDVNAQLDGMVEIRKNPGGDEITVFLELTPDDWYYFSFEQNQLGVLTTDQDINSQIESKSKGGAKGNQYGFLLANQEEKAAFVERFNQDYKGVNKPAEAKKVEEKPKKEEKKDGF